MHGWRFELRDGTSPRPARATVYPVKAENGSLYLRLSPSEQGKERGREINVGCSLIVRESRLFQEKSRVPRKASFEKEAIPHFDTLMRTALRLSGDRARAEDAVQETLFARLAFVLNLYARHKLSGLIV